MRHVGHRLAVMDLGFTSDSAYLVSVSHDSTLKLWDPREEGDELVSRRLTRLGAGRGGYQFGGVSTTGPAAPRSGTHLGGVSTTGPAAPRSGTHRTRVATVGAEREEDDRPGETLMLWDVASRAEADGLRALTGGAKGDDRGSLPRLLSLARELQVMPAIRKDQVPVCR
jgi:WD40 repeat protein